MAIERARRHAAPGHAKIARPPRFVRGGGTGTATRGRPIVIVEMESESCFICQRNPVEGRIPRYDIEVCRRCWEDNWNGWAKEHEARIAEHLRRNELPVPVRNVFGLFPRA
jgi:hypothetical protein